ncbi:ABC transporter ATP-binding protein [Gleimia sp. 6138-11-ORH1]|uniref:ABC transporter ATP-binding protein n=1 Tax=Gleimia sp. 6138-11-ORH1 TaxID=2973937 RepID=UPI002167B5BE|nr:ABC transporter ATP-binding protein [Gleimia sp. 6138-11-ORH1]MCS4483950.1 ABC transporter ATP-binding protein [Gleimia sp. 6138-11-ORH1]
MDIPALEMRNLSKVFGNTIAVGNVNLRIPKGSFFGVVGPNGAGKTTSLNMATGLLIPDQGTVFINGIDIWANPAEAKPLLGVMPDGLRLFDRLSGPALVSYFGMLRGLSKTEAENRAVSLIEVLGLTEAGNKLVADYSAGMTKKVTLACALVHNPEVLVLDEPFEAVDPISAATITEILNNFVAHGGTVVLSSHVMETVQKLCTHVAIYNQGRILAAGTTAEVAAGMDLGERFAQLIGGVKSAEGLEWLRH